MLVMAENLATSDVEIPSKELDDCLNLIFPNGYVVPSIHQLTNNAYIELTIQWTLKKAMLNVNIVKIKAIHSRKSQYVLQYLSLAYTPPLEKVYKTGRRCIHFKDGIFENSSWFFAIPESRAASMYTAKCVLETNEETPYYGAVLPDIDASQKPYILEEGSISFYFQE